MPPAYVLRVTPQTASSSVRCGKLALWALFYDTTAEKLVLIWSQNVCVEPTEKHRSSTDAVDFFMESEPRRQSTPCYEYSPELRAACCRVPS